MDLRVGRRSGRASHLCAGTGRNKEVSVKETTGPPPVDGYTIDILQVLPPRALISVRFAVADYRVTLKITRFENLSAIGVGF